MQEKFRCPRPVNLFRTDGNDAELGKVRAGDKLYAAFTSDEIRQRWKGGGCARRAQSVWILFSLIILILKYLAADDEGADWMLGYLDERSYHDYGWGQEES